MSSYLTKEEAIELAKQYGVEQEVQYLIEHGFTPDEALREWDCPPEEERL